VRIDRLRVKNFRGFVDREFTFAPGFNVFVGENGAGKTSALDAIALLLSSIAERLRGKREGFSLNESRDARRVLHSLQDTITQEQQWPVALECGGLLNDQGIGWGRKFSRQGEEVVSGQWSNGQPFIRNHFYDHDVQKPADAIANAVMRGELRTIPALAYYPSSRLWTFPTIELEEVTAPGSRLRGYEGWHTPDAQVRRWLTWFKTQELIRLQEGSAPPVFGAVRAAVVACVEHCTDIAWIARAGELVLTFDDGRRVPFRDLSDGQRSMCALVGDLAHRCAELNPQLGLVAATETPGIALIDEIDLHLHPRWQRRVVDDLRRVFPRVQFFATTHSPFIIQSLRPGELIDLDGRDVGEYAQQPIEDIAEEVMGVEVPQRGERSRKMTEAAEEYYRALDAIPQATPRRGRPTETTAR